MTAIGHDQGPTEPAGAASPLRRSREDRMLFGVCGGLARHLGVDPAVVRVAFALLAVFGGSGLLLYLIAVVAIPSEDPGETIVPASPSLSSNTAAILGAVLVGLGSLMLATRLIPGFSDLFGPLLLVGLGVVVLLAARR